MFVLKFLQRENINVALNLQKVLQIICGMTGFLNYLHKKVHRNSPMILKFKNMNIDIHFLKKILYLQTVRCYNAFGIAQNFKNINGWHCCAQLKIFAKAKTHSALNRDI